MTFRLDEVIPGWTEGLQAMRPGGVSVLIVPPGLGYGKRPQGRIPPDSTLVFRVELLEIR
jgi:FKBP-type peptidyl-prolyl cis-trans isomerase FkpA